MNFEILIQNLKTALKEYYSCKYSYGPKRTAKIELLRSIRTFIEYYQKTTDDFNGEELKLTYPSLSKTYSSCSKVIHANYIILSNLKAKGLKKDLKILAIHCLGRDTYTQIKNECKWEVEY